MTNPKAVWAFLVAALAWGALVAGGAVAYVREDVGLIEAVAAVPVGGFLALVSLSLARRARFEHQRTLGRAGGRALAALGRFFGATALLVAVTGALALAVFAILLLLVD